MSQYIRANPYFGWHGMHMLGDTGTRQNFIGKNAFLLGASITRQISGFEVNSPNFTRLAGVNASVLAAPGVIGTDGGKSVQISPDRQYMVVGVNTTTPNYGVYKLADMDFTTTYTPLQTAPNGNCNAFAFSANGSYCASVDSGTKLYIYNVSSTSVAANAWTNVTNKTFTGASVHGVAFSPNGTWIIAGAGKDTSTNQYVKIYLQSDWSEVAEPTQPAGVVYDVAFSADSSMCAVAHTTTPFLTVYTTASTPWTKLADVSSVPPGNCTGVCFLGNSYLCVSSSTTPFKVIYKVSDWSKLATPFDSAPGAVGPARYSPDGLMLAVSANPSLYVYDISGESYTRRSTSVTYGAPYYNNFAWLQKGVTNTY